MAAAVFLECNGWLVIAEETAFEQLVLRVASGHVGKDEIAEFFRQNTRPL